MIIKQAEGKTQFSEMERQNRILAKAKNSIQKSVKYDKVKQNKKIDKL